MQSWNPMNCQTGFVAIMHFGFVSQYVQYLMPVCVKVVCRLCVLPLPKVHPPMSIDSDTRPISLTPTVSKVRESIAKTCILKLVDNQRDDH